jgi:alkylhydroperoxidase/carboxymuconolactone decarboxylase family protein YurZ
LSASVARHWATYIEGSMTDEAAFRKDADKMLQVSVHRMRQPASSTEKIAMPLDEIKTPDDALKDIKHIFGFVPHFLSSFPRPALVGAWKELRVVKMNPDSPLDARTTDLIGLALAAQIPSKNGVYFYTKSARIDGAPDKEIHEAVAQSAVTRHWSTFLNGAQIDEAQFRTDVTRALDFAKTKTSAPRAPAATDQNQAPKQQPQSQQEHPSGQ